MAGDDAHHQPGASAGIAEIEWRGGRDQPADAAASHDPFAVFADDFGAERFDGLGGRHHVGCLQKAADSGFAYGQCAEHQRTVRDGLVSGDGGATLQRPRSRCGKLRHDESGRPDLKNGYGETITLEPPT
jgi:hypothetical protein